MLHMVVPHAQGVARGAIHANVSHSSKSKPVVRRKIWSRCASSVVIEPERTGVYRWEELNVPRLEDNGRVFKEQLRIKAHEAGPNQRCNLITVSNILQEIASNNIVSLHGRSEQYFAADPKLAEKALISVLTRMQIRMHSYPRWGDVVNVETYFQSEGRVGARRDWVLTNAATGEQFGCATSSWVMVNYKTRRLSKMPDDIRDEYLKLMPDPPRHCLQPEETRQKLPALPDDAPKISSSHVASYVDMDMNNHVNNTAYLTWILGTIPDDVQTNYFLEQYEVDYKAEGVAGYSLVSESAEVAEVEGYSSTDDIRQFITSISLPGDKPTELIRARTTWTKRATISQS